jgi:hypothetical protein
MIWFAINDFHNSVFLSHTAQRTTYSYSEQGDTNLYGIVHMSTNGMHLRTSTVTYKLNNQTNKQTTVEETRNHTDGRKY